MLSAQLTNVSDYQGYRLSTILGFEAARRSSEAEDTLTSTRGFVTVYAGIGLLAGIGRAHERCDSQRPQ